MLSPLQAIADYESRNEIPRGWISFAISRSSPNGAWQRLERGEIVVGEEFFADFRDDLHREALWREFQATGQPGIAIASLPNVDGRSLFWKMMQSSTTPDPWIFPALKKLKSSGKFILGALSNTAIFPPDHAYSIDAHHDLRSQFDIFISSAHVGLRKPDHRIYDLAIKELNKCAKAQQRRKEHPSDIGGEVKPEDVIFLDDIGENLKAAKALGMRTIKVHLGKGKDAVKELELLTGLALLEEGGPMSML